MEIALFYFILMEKVFLINSMDTFFSVLVCWWSRAGDRGACPPIDMLAPAINKLTRLKTVAFVINFKL